MYRLVLNTEWYIIRQRKWRMTVSAERGRPRSFEPEVVLEQAMALFWRHGYSGTSFGDLTEATGLTKPSLYAAFGDKEALYLKCLQHYVEHHLRQQSLHL